MIRASAVNAGGKTGGYTVPSPHAQAEVIRACLRRAGIEPRTIGCVEAHGTGTPLGDPIEMSGLAEAFRERIDNGLVRGVERVAVGSVKSNIGHLESTGRHRGPDEGADAVTARRLAPSLHSAELNPAIDLTGTPFHIPRRRCPGPGRSPNTPTAGGWSCPAGPASAPFGGGGANAHLIVEEYRTPVPRRGSPPAAPNSSSCRRATRNACGHPPPGWPRSWNRPRPRTRPELRPSRPAGAEADCLRLAAEVVQADAADLDAVTPLREYGFGAAELALLGKRIDAAFGVRPSPETLVGSATVRALALGLAGPPAERPDTEHALALSDVAHTLQTGREPLEARLAFVATDLAQVRDTLRTYAADGSAPGASTGRAPARPAAEDQDRLAEALRDGDLEAVGRCWTRGADVNWRQARGEDTPVRRVGLPTYPFARKRYWLPSLRRGRRATRRSRCRTGRRERPAGDCRFGLEPAVGHCGGAVRRAGRGGRADRPGGAAADAGTGPAGAPVIVNAPIAAAGSASNLPSAAVAERSAGRAVVDVRIASGGAATDVGTGPAAAPGVNAPIVAAGSASNLPSAAVAERSAGRAVVGARIAPGGAATDVGTGPAAAPARERPDCGCRFGPDPAVGCRCGAVRRAGRGGRADRLGGSGCRRRYGSGCRGGRREHLLGDCRFGVGVAVGRRFCGSCGHGLPAR